MDNLIVFTHVPKTSGTSFRVRVVEPNIPADEIYHYSTLERFLADRAARTSFVWGHLPYGLHHFTRRPVSYITFLRDPIDRAVSYYYFVKDSDVTRYKHPDRDFADAVSLKAFYEDRRFQNVQTRYLAGFLSKKYYPLPVARPFEERMLETALDHLFTRYACYGILERFDASVERFRSRFGWNRTVEVAPQKKTGARPKMDALDDETVASLRANNRLDCALYEAALRHFDHQAVDARNTAA